jgi:hypothetical protein
MSYFPVPYVGLPRETQTIMAPGNAVVEVMAVGVKEQWDEC